MTVLYKLFVIFWIPTPCSVILFWRNLLLPSAGCLNLSRCMLKGCGGKKVNLIFVVPCIMLNSEINPTRCNNCVYSLQWLYSTCFG